MDKRISRWATIALLGAVPLVGACGERADAPDYGEQVNENLQSANLDDVQADWRENEQILRLSGEVERETDRQRAQELAQQVVGTAGRVVNEVRVEGIETGEMDGQIEDRLGRMFEDRTEWDFDGRGVSFDSEAGVVTITGTVESQGVKDRIGEQARNTEGVRDVVNGLEVDASRGPNR